MAWVFQQVAATVNATADTAGTGTARVALPTLQRATHAYTVRLANTGTVTAFFALGDANVTADVATDIPLLAGSVEVFNVPSGATHISFRTASGTAVCYATVGVGE